MATPIIIGNNNEVLGQPLGKPDPPVVGKVTHHSIELYWEKTASVASDVAAKGDGRLRFTVQEQEPKTGEFGVVYTGYAQSHVFDGLEPKTEYTYRLRVLNNLSESPWSALVTVSTTKEPFSNEYLQKAVSRGDIKLVAKILEQKETNVSSPDRFGFTPIMNAAAKGHTKIISMMLENNMDPNEQNSSGKNALMIAAYNGALDAVKVLARCQGNEVAWSTRDRNGSTALHWAADSGNLLLIDWVLGEGADVNGRDTAAGWTALLRCCALSGNVSVAKLLINRGAEINVKDKDGKTPLMVAVLNGHHALVQLLVERGADIFVVNAFGKSAIEMANTFDRRAIVKVLEKKKDEIKSSVIRKPTTAPAFGMKTYV